MSNRHVVIAGAKRHLHGYRRGFHDPRDRLLSAVHPFDAKALPPSASTRSIYQPPVRDQGELGSCTANAGCEAAGYLYHIEKSGQPDPMFSRLDLYAMTRLAEGTPLSEDSGCFVRDVFKTMSKTGVCLEKTWPYNPRVFNRRPSTAALREALRHKAVTYLACKTLGDIKASIAGGFPVIGGFTCFESLQSDAVAATGDIPMPSPGEGEIGGHCVLFDSYDDRAQMLSLQNSWGQAWGAPASPTNPTTRGFGRLPYGYVLEDLASDFWSLRVETTA